MTKPISLEFLFDNHEISKRTYNALCRGFYNKLQYLEDLQVYSSEDFMKIRNIGCKGVYQIERALERRGMKLKEVLKPKPFRSMTDPDLIVDELLVKVMQTQIEQALDRCHLKVTPFNIDKVAGSDITDELTERFRKMVTGGLAKLIAERADKLGLEWEHENLPIS